MKEINVAGLGG